MPWRARSSIMVPTTPMLPTMAVSATVMLPAAAASHYAAEAAIPGTSASMGLIDRDAKIWSARADMPVTAPPGESTFSRIFVMEASASASSRSRWMVCTSVPPNVLGVHDVPLFIPHGTSDAIGFAGMRQDDELKKKPAGSGLSGLLGTG